MAGRPRYLKHGLARRPRPPPSALAQTAASDAEGGKPWTGRPPAQRPPEELPRVPLWQWRRNPLRRRSDLAQAWIALSLPLWPSLSSAPPSREPTRCTPHSCWPLLRV
ncbi:hypothetical protein E3E14_05995 [Streptomyces sp. ICN441]|nr:hypothetical protein E3E14_05995 [Streptomyces sp. ICN441]